MSEPMMETLNVTGAAGTRLAQRKYDAVREAILAVVPTDDDGVEFKALASLIEPRLPPDILPEPGSASWLATTVKLDLEARGLIERIPNVTPQRLRRTT